MYLLHEQVSRYAEQNQRDGEDADQYAELAIFEVEVTLKACDSLAIRIRTVH
jgi:hypothetical protein